jgi:hypothetical protein
MPPFYRHLDFHMEVVKRPVEFCNHRLLPWMDFTMAGALRAGWYDLTTLRGHGRVSIRLAVEASARYYHLIKHWATGACPGHKRGSDATWTEGRQRRRW